MLTGWQYRLTSFLGAITLTFIAVLSANQPTSQLIFTTYVPVFNRLDPTVLRTESLHWAVTLSVIAVAGSLVPLYKPRPRRVLDTILFTQKRIIMGGLVLATFGYFQWSHRLPRTTLVMTIGILLVTIPAWFVWIRSQPDGQDGPVLIVGDDPDQIAHIASSTELPLLGYLCPTNVMGTGTLDEGDEAEIDREPPRAIADGGFVGLRRLGGLSRFEDIVIEQDVDTVVLAFQRPDRAEFFGVLEICYEHGVAAKVHREYADSVLVGSDVVNDLVDVNVEPIDPQDYVAKRLFDIAFAGTALLFLAPVIAIIAVAIKVDSPGPVLYHQERTTGFGETFTISKFRSMITDAEAESGAKISEEDEGGVDPRVTRIGRILRKTHLDEIPQLGSILVGNMSVVGPRPERPEIDDQIKEVVTNWQKRWFIRPGLTGLAQVNETTGHEPAEKLNCDVKYINNQSFVFDMKIVLRQIYMVLLDTYDMVRKK